MSSKFKIGDKVIAGIHPGKISSVWEKNGKHFCTVVFDDENLIPSKLDYDQSYIKFEKKHEEVCPCCGNRWHIVKFNMRTWKDCIKCGKSQEELVEEDSKKENNKKGKTPGLSKKQEDELLEEFEKMLNGINGSGNDSDDDDDDDFFNYGIF